MTRRRPQGGKVADPMFRRVRAVRAGLAAKAAYAQQRRRRGEGFPTKGDAYDAGYRRGYQTALAWWKRRFERQQIRARVSKRRKAAA